MKRLGPLMLLAFLIPAGMIRCVLDSDPDHSETLAANRAKWSGSKPAEFSYRLERGCFCVPDWTGPFLVQATGDSVTRVRQVLRSSPDTVEVTEKLQDYSILAVFDYLEPMLRKENHKESVQFHPTYGYPESAEIDHQAMTADDEFSVRILDFRVDRTD